MYCLLYYGCFVCGICCICLLFVFFVLLVVYKSKDSFGLLLVVSQFHLLSGYGDCTRYRSLLLRHLFSFYHYCFVCFELIRGFRLRTTNRTHIISHFLIKKNIRDNRVRKEYTYNMWIRLWVSLFTVSGYVAIV